jgi:hypothetical protein
MTTPFAVCFIVVVFGSIIYVALRRPGGRGRVRATINVLRGLVSFSLDTGDDGASPSPPAATGPDGLALPASSSLSLPEGPRNARATPAKMRS